MQSGKEDLAVIPWIWIHAMWLLHLESALDEMFALGITREIVYGMKFE